MSSAPPKSNVEATGASLSLAPDLNDAAASKQPFMKPLGKHWEQERYLDTPLQSAFARTSNTFSDRSVVASDNASDYGSPFLGRGREGQHLSSESSASMSLSWKQRISTSIISFWVKNKGLALVTISQLFGVMMNVTIRILEKDGVHGPGMHPFQILFVRMVGTLILSSIYLWWAKIEDAPFGAKGIRMLLVARGVGGFFGVYGMYYSLQYLPLSDATVITFLAPIVACWACSILIKEPFTRTEQVAGIVSLLGVMVIARPSSLLSANANNSPQSAGSSIDGAVALPNANTTTLANEQNVSEASPGQRAGAVGAALIGVLGAACAYTTIRWIGKRAHPLISVNYFAVWCTIVSAVALLEIPGVDFRLPASWVQWAYLLFLGICGFVMQFLLTAGLAYEKGSRATNMVYTQMLFAIAFDKIVFDVTPDLLSIIGSSLILGSSLYVAMLQNSAVESKRVREGVVEEEMGLMQDDDDTSDESIRDERRHLRGIQEVQARTIR